MTLEGKVSAFFVRIGFIISGQHKPGKLRARGEPTVKVISGANGKVWFNIRVIPLLGQITIVMRCAGPGRENKIPVSIFIIKALAKYYFRTEYEPGEDKY